MSLLVKSSAAALALAAASLVGCSTYGTNANVASNSSDVKCFGVNKCKGFNDCKTATNSCKGLGSCKGQGFVSMPATSCDHLGGTIKS
jgi:uncharacterized membrane protein